MISRGICNRGRRKIGKGESKVRDRLIGETCAYERPYFPLTCHTLGALGAKRTKTMPLFAAGNYFLHIAQIRTRATYLANGINRLVRLKRKRQLNWRRAEAQECRIDPSKLEQPRILLMKLHVNFASNSLYRVNATYVTWSASTNPWERLREAPPPSGS